MNKYVALTTSFIGRFNSWYSKWFLATL